jgi:hypothetical protein
MGGNMDYLLFSSFESTCSGLAYAGLGTFTLGGVSTAERSVSFSQRLAPSCLQQLHD